MTASLKIYLTLILEGVSRMGHTRRHLKDGEILDWTGAYEWPGDYRLFLWGRERLAAMVFHLERTGAWVVALRFADGLNGAYVDHAGLVVTERLVYPADELEIEPMEDYG